MTPEDLRTFTLNVLHVPAAVYAGKAEGANPFCPDESEHVMWAHGFAMAREEHVTYCLAV